MKIKLLIVSAFVAFVAAWMVACVPSLNPLYTEKDIVFDPALVGTWTEGEENIWTFAKDGDKAYHLVIKDKEGITGEFKVHLTKLGQWRFVDMFPDTAAMEALKRQDFYKSHYLPTHTFYLLKQVEPTLQMASLDLDWLDKYLTENPTAVAHTRIGEPDGTDKRVLFTATTEELQKFMQKMAGTAGAFADSSELKKK